MKKGTVIRTILTILLFCLLFRQPVLVVHAISDYGNNGTSGDDRPRGHANPDGDGSDSSNSGSSNDSGSNNNNSDPGPRGPANPDGGDDDGDDVVPEGSGDDDDGDDVVPEGGDSTSNNDPNAGSPAAATNPVQNSSSNTSNNQNTSSGSSNSSNSGSSDSGNSSSNDNSTPAPANTEEPSIVESAPVTGGGGQPAKTNNNAATTVTEPTELQQSNSFSSPVLKDNNETIINPFEAAKGVWEGFDDKEKNLVKIGGGVIGADIVFNAVRKAVKGKLRKKKGNTKKDKRSKKSHDSNDFERPEIEFEPKSVITCLRDSLSNRELVEMFNKKKFIEEKAIAFDAYDELDEKLHDEKSDLIILDVNTPEEFAAFKELTTDKDTFALIVDDNLLNDIKDELNSIKEEKRISGFVPESAKKEAKLIKLVLPLFKPDISGENALELVGSVADALGIPYVGDIIDFSMNGKEIIDTVKEGDMDASDKASIIGSIAEILGFDAVADVTDVIEKVKMVKSVTNSESIAPSETQDATLNKE